jgi:hypothetical protein
MTSIEPWITSHMYSDGKRALSLAKADNGRHDTPVIISCSMTPPTTSKRSLFAAVALCPQRIHPTGYVPVHHSSAMTMTRGSVERNDSEQHAMIFVNIADLVTKPVRHPRIDVPQLTHELRIDKRHIAAAAAGVLATIWRDYGLTLLFGKRLRNAERLGCCNLLALVESVSDQALTVLWYVGQQMNCTSTFA